MNKKFWIQVFVLPNMRSVVAYLRFKDENSTGADDEAADAIDYAIDRLDKYLASTP